MKKNKTEKFLVCMIIFFIVILCTSTIMIIMWDYHNIQNEKILSEISKSINIINSEKKENINIENNNTEKIDETENIEYNVDFEKLKEKNQEVVGWLKVEGINIEYPVVKTKNNSYYMNHNFEKDYNSAGWIFVDYKNKLDGTDKNIVIYGHNRRDGSMFSSLKNILKKDWYENKANRIITFITENETYNYEVFSVYQIEEEDYYIQTSFKDNSKYEKFINTLKKRSIYDFNTEVTVNDSILTLSTCANNNRYRIALHAKK